MKYLTIVNHHFKITPTSFIICVFLACMASQKTYGQNILKANFNFKEGVYRTLEDFKNQIPTIDIEDLDGKYVYRLKSGDCTGLKYFDGKQVFELRDDEYWGFFIDGELYIRHYRAATVSADYFKPMKCAFKAMKLGPITSYFIVFDRNDRPDYGIYQTYPTPVADRPPRVDEFAVDMVTGNTYSLKTGVKALAKLIRTDPYFEKMKIKKKNIDVVIYQYNERNPMFDFDSN